MLASKPPTFLLATHQPALREAMEPTLRASGAQVVTALSAEAALQAMTAPQPPGLALLDAELPGMELEDLLTAVRASAGGHRLPVVLISDNVDEHSARWMAEGVLDDLIPRSAHSPYGRLRLDFVVRLWMRMRELERLRESCAVSAQLDSLTGVYNRETLLSMLFRETDRAQRLRNSLSLLLLDIDGFGHWNERLGNDVCDALLCQVAERTTRLLRSYDLLGRMGKDEFLAVLPGCDTANAAMLAERLRAEVYAVPFRAAGEAIRLSACFGIATSEGRSPVVVLREAEQALEQAKKAGPESMQCFRKDEQDRSGDFLPAWFG